MPNFLMIKTNDNRKIVTETQNLHHLENLLKTFKLELFLIQASKNTKPANLNKIAHYICDPKTNMQIKDYKIKSKIYPKINKTNIIKEYIKNIILSNDVVLIKDIKEKYQASDATIYNQFNAARKELEDNNIEIIKLGAGKYCRLYRPKN